MPAALFSFLKIALASQGLLGLHANFKTFCSRCVKSASSHLIGLGWGQVLVTKCQPPGELSQRSTHCCLCYQRSFKTTM